MNQLPSGKAGKVSTHILDTSSGKPASGVSVTISTRQDGRGEWKELGRSNTGDDGRINDFPALPDRATQARLTFDTEKYLSSRAARDGQEGEKVFFPEVPVIFAVEPGKEYHIPLILNPYGYSTYRGS
ncbi:hydroxyisourate hydrolase [Streptomyces sp. x-80]|uniref:hydroxyisourate hydrolase n=1 Tax=Streptomyces sp. x-80 TaxID=2789282 RepID=UPI00397F7E93